MRGAMLLAGVGFGLWGLWLMRDFNSGQMISIGTWFAGAVMLHDFLLAPIVVLLGVAASRLLPGHFRAATATAFLIWATLTVTFVAVLSGQGGKPDNDTVLHRPYVLSWVVLTLVIASVAALMAYRRRQTTRVQAVTLD